MSSPFFDQEFTFTQPDGTPLKVRGWGDERRAVFYTLDGQTVVRDPVTGFYQYATITPEGDELRPTGIRADLALEGAALIGAPQISPLKARMLAETAPTLLVPRWEERRRQEKLNLLLAMAGEVAAAPPQRQTVGDYQGLCLLIDFPDTPATITREEVEAFCNQPGYSGFGNRGSVRDYFLDNSAGKLRYSTTVAPYYTAKNKKSYYTDNSIPYTQRTRDLIKEALAYHKAQGLDFSRLTADSGENVFATNILYAGPVENNWSEGLWPHASRLQAAYPVAPGRRVLDYQITALGTELTLGTYCHENGHMLCDFPDLYNYHNQRKGDGVYCLMCGGGNANPKNPTQIGAYLKYRAGWGDPAVTVTAGQKLTITAGKNQFFVHARNDREYFILENRQRSERDQSLPDAGIAIWHIDELGSNSEPEKAPAGHQRFECTLVQADGRNDLGMGSNQGDSTDLFDSTQNARFAGQTSPSSNWFDGTPSGLDLFDISPSGPLMVFSAKV